MYLPKQIVFLKRGWKDTVFCVKSFSKKGEKICDKCTWKI
jgi:hypothetical protein